MLLSINLFSNGKRLLIVFFSRIVLVELEIDSSQVVVTCRYVTMVFTINLFSNGKGLLMVFFSLIVLTKVTVNSSQVAVTCRYVTVVVRGATLGSTNQKAEYRSRGTNGPISVQHEIT